MNNKELKQRLYENGNTGADLSPGDPVALAALNRIVELENLLSRSEYRSSRETTLAAGRRAARYGY